MPMAKQLVAASLSNDQLFYRKVLNEIRYHLRRNMTAYLSHRKKILQTLVLQE